MRGHCQERETTKDFIYTYRSIGGLIYLVVVFYERTAPYWTVRKGTLSCAVLYNKIICKCSVNSKSQAPKLASIPHVTHASHDEELEKLKEGSTSSQPQEAAQRLIIHRLSLSALVLPAPEGAEEAAALPALSGCSRVLLPQEELLPPRSPAAAFPGGRAGPSPEVTGGDRSPSASVLPRAAPDVPPPPLAGAPWNSMTPGGAGRG